ncbi:hypothetical protein GY45DRAFT_1318147 [Cubamyces sp. BRFM 1775]|nr:hypothetical protein GY45DRAFT_1318147 [Cubamyces sp. BRFM 1775]
MEETDEVPPIDAARRRLPQVSRRRPSHSSLHQQHQQRRPSASTTGRSTPPISSSPTRKPEHAGPSTPQSQSPLHTLHSHSTQAQNQNQTQNQNQSPPAAHMHIPLPRARLNSIVTRGLDAAQSAVASPLAQIFQPLIVDDDGGGSSLLGLDEQGAQEGAGGGGGIISYGPATRRRLSSMHVATNPPRRARTYSVAAGALSGQGAGHGHGHGHGYGHAIGEHVAGSSPSGENAGRLRFPTHSSSPVMRSHLGLIAAQAPLSESPDERGEDQDEDRGRAGGPRETASQVEEEEEEEGAGASVAEEGGARRAEWERRLESMEERQRRMEEMLVEIARGLKR